jgi:leucyl/phenylalanyl-tRNA--protein transferase
MFYSVPDASKAAVAWFVPRLAELGYKLVDCQQETGHMLRFGAEMIDRAEFLRLLSATGKTAKSFCKMGT